MQALYAFFQSENERVDIAERQLLNSIEKLYELFILQFSLIVEIADFARIRSEDAKQKFLPTKEELNPNTRFVDNRFICALADNIDFKKKMDYYKISWADENELIRKIFNKLKESSDYKKYLEATEDNFINDKAIVVKIFKKFIFPSEVLQSICEERSIYWVDDFDSAAIMVLKAIESFNESFDAYTSFPALYKNMDERGRSEDLEFIKILFRKTIINSSKFNEILTENLKNWELDRIAMMDMILIKMALTEFIDFPSIPVKVTMNEYIELSKIYSTPKSNVFVNGILDKMVGDLKNQKQINKMGRGLME